MADNFFRKLYTALKSPLHALRETQHLRAQIANLDASFHRLSVFLESDLAHIQHELELLRSHAPHSKRQTNDRPDLDAANGSGRLRSTVCRLEDFFSPWYLRWVEELIHAQLIGNVIPESVKFHRKNWEWAAITQVLSERGKLVPGVSGLGFAVGQEPLPSLLAKYGVNVLATDLNPNDQRAEGWKSSAQHAANRKALHYDEIVPEDVFLKKVTFQHADMNDLSAFEKSSFDFIWSSCALEHLGGLNRGIEFIMASSMLLKVGGIAVHTTEYNISSGLNTIEHGGSVIYRRSDLRHLVSILEAKGFVVEPFDFSSGVDGADLVYDTPPYYTRPGVQHVKLLLDGYVTTSILIIIQRTR